MLNVNNGTIPGLAQTRPLSEKRITVALMIILKRSINHLPQTMALDPMQ
jgi:hypothetical protein